MICDEVRFIDRFVMCDRILKPPQAHWGITLGGGYDHAINGRDKEESLQIAHNYYQYVLFFVSDLVHLVACVLGCALQLLPPTS